MSDNRGSGPQQRKLRLELRHLRKNAGLSQRQVADSLEWSLSKVVRIEQGAVGVSITDLRALLHHYDVTDKAIVEELLDLARRRSESRWWEAYTKDVLPVVSQLVELEDVATQIRQFQANIVPGLLQTEDVARTVIAMYQSDESLVDRWVRLRLGRQRILADENREFIFILDEAVTHRHIGSAEVMAAQMRHLLEVNERPNISISVIPFTHGTHQAMQGSYTVIETPVGYTEEQVDSVVVLQGPFRDSIIRRDADHISDYAEAFAKLEDMAVPLDKWEGASKFR
ncbi:transcriptional regulator with XRE-family HTH domain [Actinokineospora baliensis]|uniref:helix-turn-helix domain-containing protein n=1 Tax=Actinokineospora baliensis TaxID=547056 RepID=UPI00195E08D7|nr:helix-turn-helix transcriptional regulator [Actinokineospora baliensis]MBM7775062.1 transcriptional regulator with XRE-family HTH domain [Actinokineospora baliensis]